MFYSILYLTVSLTSRIIIRMKESKLWYTLVPVLRDFTTIIYQTWNIVFRPVTNDTTDANYPGACYTYHRIVPKTRFTSKYFPRLPLNVVVLIDLNIRFTRIVHFCGWRGRGCDEYAAKTIVINMFGPVQRGVAMVEFLECKLRLVFVSLLRV